MHIVSDILGFIKNTKKSLSNLKPTALLSGVTLLTLLTSLSIAGEAHASTQVPSSRLALLSKGINGDNIVNNTFVANYTSDDTAQLKAMGMTYIRIPIDPSWIIAAAPVENQKPYSDAARAAIGVARLDAAVAQFAQSGFAVMLVIQPQPKLRAMTAAQQEKIITRAVSLIVKRYAPLYTPDQLFFETLNEPKFDPAVWNTYVAQLVALIRQTAPAHTIIVPPVRADNPDFFPSLTPLADQNIVYTMHIYQPAGITSQGAGVMPQPNYRFPQAPGSPNPQEWTTDRLSAFMHEGIDWAAANNVPLIINEFGATSIADPTSRMNWVNFVRQTAEANHIGWAWWSQTGRLYGLRPRGAAWDAALVQALGNPPTGN